MVKTKKVGILTGASSGMGRHIAKFLCEEGHTIYVVARRKHLLEQLKQETSSLPGEIKIISGDLIDQNFRENIISQVVSENGKIDFLINNAGYGTLIPLERQDLADIKKMYEINCTAYEHLTKLVIPIMKKQDKGRIICTCSIAGLNAPALLSTYGATKYAVLGYMKPLRYELENTNVSLGLVFPPRMRTDFWTVALSPYNMTLEQKEKAMMLITKGTTDPKKIAKSFVDNLNTDKFMILPHWMSWMAYNILRHMYWGYDYFMNKFMLKQMKGILAEYEIKDGYFREV